MDAAASHELVEGLIRDAQSYHRRPQEVHGEIRIIENLDPAFVEAAIFWQDQWPEEKLKKFVLDYLRESCQWATARSRELELDNRDARMRGVSYKERQSTTIKIEALNFLYGKWRERGIEYSKRELRLTDFFRPGDELYPQERGVEHIIRAAILF